MKWNDFTGIKIGDSRLEEETTIECPNCGKNIYLRKDVVLTTYPPQFGYFCKSCGWVGTSFVKWSPPVIPTSIIDAVLGDDE